MSSSVFSDSTLFANSQLIFAGLGKNIFNCCQWNSKNVEPYISDTGVLVYKLDDEIKLECYLKETRQPQNVQQLEVTGYQLMLKGYFFHPRTKPDRLLPFTAGVGIVNGEHYHVQLLPVSRSPVSPITVPILGEPIIIKVIEKLVMRGNINGR